MPIIDYKQAAETAEKALFAREDISETNKEYLRDFLEAYDVSPARRSMFCRQIIPLIKKVNDVKILFNNPKLTNNIFHNLKETLSPSYYATIINVSLRFMRWLNDNEKPKGLKDIHNISKKAQKRDLKPCDMITWEDALKAIEYTPSLQIKAIIATQLDGGFRPSEFIDLDIGDIRKEGSYLIAHVNYGKTGPRDVFLWRSVPYLQRWLSLHPNKGKKTAPLWIIETPLNSRRGRPARMGDRYNYFAVQKRVKDLFRWININKPADFYNLRHSSAVLRKLDNVPIDLAAESMGHSTEHFVETYGRLSVQDKIDRLDKVHGLGKTTAEHPQGAPIECIHCGTVNVPTNDSCERCGSPLSLRLAVSKAKEGEQFAERLDKQEKLMELFVKALAAKGEGDMRQVAKEAIAAGIE